MTAPQQPYPQRCVIIKSCRVCPWIELTTMPGIIDNPDGTPKQLIWCLGKDDSKVDLIESELDAIHKDCPLPTGCAAHSAASHQRIEQAIKELEKRRKDIEMFAAPEMESDIYNGEYRGLSMAIALLQAGERK